MRDGFRVYTSIGEIGEIIKLKATENNLYALVIQNNGGWELHLYKLLPSGGRDLGVVSTFISNNYSDYDLVAIGDCLLILTKGRRPYWYRE